MTASAEGRGTDPWASQAAGIYIHLPFCSAICPYCDFAVTVGGRDKREGLVEALLCEVDRTGPEFGMEADTVYLGGGTPSLMDGEQLAAILEACHRALRLDAPRLFMEANPEDVTPRRLGEWLELGLTTLSLGVQSFETPALTFLGRRHSVAEARGAIELALDMGIPTVSVDLIYALPGQTREAWSRQLESVAALGVHHLSCYQLTVNPGTPFWRRRETGSLPEMPDASQAELFEVTHRHLHDLGLEAYEVSNFARSPEHRSAHNIKYWSGAPYLGLGPSAHSFRGRNRWWNVPDVGAYVQRLALGTSPIEEYETLEPGDRLLEELMLGLRTVRGVDLGDLGRRYQTDLLALNRERLDAWQKEGRVHLENEVLRPRLSGLLLADALAREFELGSGSVFR